MNNSDYITASQNYAKDKQDAYEQSLSYLLSGLDEAKLADQNAANVRYQNLLTQIRQQIPGIQEQFQRNAKAAYINKMQNLQQIDADLNRLGVNTQGFGVTQRLLNETAYGNVYGQLAIDYNESMRDIANQETNALGDLNAQLADLDAAYAKDRLDTQKYIGEQGLNIYNQEYKNYYNDLQYQDDLKQQALENELAKRKQDLAEQEYQNQLKQQEWENAFKEKQYEDKLKQQQFENDLATKEYKLKEKQVNAQIASYKSSSSRSYSSGGNSNNNNSGNSKVVNTNYCLDPKTFGGTNTNAFAQYQGILTTALNKGGITASNLSTLLSNYQKSGVFTSAQVNAIKKQFGI